LERRHVIRLAPEENGNGPKARICYIWTVDVSTGDGRKLAAHSQPYVDETPSWFPDGKRIARLT
jgi:Tol biopolymer transport system component